MSRRFVGDVALVTGAGSGIGRATALALSREGATVVVAGRRKEPLAETVRLIQEGGGEADLCVADVASTEDVSRMLGDIIDSHGRLHVAVNNAGTFAATPVAEMERPAWDDVVATNLTGIFVCMQQEISHMRAHGGGTIVNVASNKGAHVRAPRLGAYVASKAAVSMLTRTAARESIAEGVRINAVSPGASDTSMSLRPGETHADRAERLKASIPAGRVAELDEVANAILWLASPESSFVVGHDLVVDGGESA